MDQMNQHKHPATTTASGSGSEDQIQRQGHENPPDHYANAPDLQDRLWLLQKALQPEATQEVKNLAIACLHEFPEGMPEPGFLRPGHSLLNTSDPVIRAYEECQMDCHARDLAGPCPSKMVLMMAQQATADLWYLNDLRIRIRAHQDSATCSPKDLEHEERLIDHAHRRYLASMKALAELHRLAIPSINVAMAGSVQVNGGINQVNVGAGDIPRAPSASDVPSPLESPQKRLQGQKHR